MNTYQWLCVLGIPGLIATILGYVGVQYKQIKAIKLGLQALLREESQQKCLHRSVRVTKVMPLIKLLKTPLRVLLSQHWR